MYHFVAYDEVEIISFFCVRAKRARRRGGKRGGRGVSTKSEKGVTGEEGFRRQEEEQGTYKSVIHLWQHTLEDPLLDVKCLEHPWETGLKDRVEVVLVVQTDEEGVGPLRHTDESYVMGQSQRSEARGARREEVGQVGEGEQTTDLG